MSRSDHLGSRPGVPQIWPLLVKNVSGEEVPAFALMRVTAVTDADFTGEIVYSVDKPNSSSLDRLIVNGPMPIPATTNARGRATWIFPTFCAFKSSDGTPAAGDNWGPVSGSWDLRLAGSGIVIMGGAASGVAMAKWAASGVITHWGVVSTGGISALTGISGSTLTPGSGTVQEYNSDGTIQTGVTETWKNWMNVAVPQHTPVMGNLESDGQIWVKVAPCGTLATS